MRQKSVQHWEREEEKNEKAEEDKEEGEKEEEEEGCWQQRKTGRNWVLITCQALC